MPQNPYESTFGVTTDPSRVPVVSALAQDALNLSSLAALNRLAELRPISASCKCKQEGRENEAARLSASAHLNACCDRARALDCRNTTPSSLLVLFLAYSTLYSMYSSGLVLAAATNAFSLPNSREGAGATLSGRELYAYFPYGLICTRRRL